MQLTSSQLGTVDNVPFDLIVPSPFNVRTVFPPEELADLSRNLAETGQKDRIKTRPSPSQPGKFELVDGERRWRAAQLAPAKTALKGLNIENQDLSDREVREIMLITFIHKKNPNPIEQARAYRALLDDGMSADELCQRMTIKKASLYESLKLLDGTPALQDKLAKRQLTTGHGILIARLQPEEQKKALQFMNLQPDTTVRRLDEYLDNQVRRSLDKAFFDRKDAELYPEAGSCDSCPKRLKDKCQDPACYAEKIRRDVQQKLDRAEADGTPLVKVSTEFGSSTPLPKDVLPMHSWAEATDKKEKAEARPAVVVNGWNTGQTMMVLSTAEKKALDKRSSTSQFAIERKRRAQVVSERLARREALTQVSAKIAKVKPAAALQVLAEAIAMHTETGTVLTMNGQPAKVEKEGYTGPVSRLIAVIRKIKTVPALLSILAQLTLVRDLDGHPAAKKSGLETVADRVKVDVKTLRRTHLAEQLRKLQPKKKKKAAKKAKAKKAKPAPVKAKAKTKRRKVQTSAQGRKGKK